MPPKKIAKTTADAGPSVAVPKEKTKRDMLYDRCLQAKEKKDFTVSDLAAFDIAADDEELTEIVQDLVDRNQFALLQKQNAFLYRLRPKAIALQ
jgi:hypothetical protein